MQVPAQKDWYGTVIPLKLCQHEPSSRCCSWSDQPQDLVIIPLAGKNIDLFLQFSLSVKKKTKSFRLKAYWLFFFSTHTFSVYVCRQARSPCSQLMVLLHSTFCCPADQGSPRTPIWEMLPLSQEQGALHLVWLKPVSSNWISPRWLINYGSFPTAGNSYHHLQSLS